MGLVVNTDVLSLTAQRSLAATTNALQTATERLSSGLRINKAADDASGLAISQGLTAQIGALTQAVRNAQDGINVVQTADGALNEVQSILQRMNTLAIQAANGGTQTASSLADTQTEVTALQSELNRIANSTTFNGVKLLDGTFTNKAFQVGATGNSWNQLSLNIRSGTPATGGFSANDLGVGSVDMTTNAVASIDLITKAIDTVSTARATLGANQNRLQYMINNLSINIENLQASNSSINDTDMAAEMSNFTRTQILQQAGTMMVRQANNSARLALNLLS